MVKLMKKIRRTFRVGVAVTIAKWVRLEVTTVGDVFQTPHLSRVMLEHIAQDCTS